MKKSICLLILAILSINIYSQNEGYTYKNEEFRVIIKFPSKPTEGAVNNAFVKQISAYSTNISTGINYMMMLQKTGIKLDISESYKSMGELSNVHEYKIGDKKVSEFDIHMNGACVRYKIINFNKINVILMVTGVSVQDKDALPFSNSVRLDDILIQNPYADNSKYFTFENSNSLNTKTDIEVSNAKSTDSNTVSKNTPQLSVNVSDVDINIPVVKVNNPHGYALIIGNEDYSSYQSDLSSEVNVAFALNDANMFKKYCIDAFGIQESNIKFLRNATLGQMNQAISWINKIIQKESGDAEVLVYYAGHGLPDEQTHESYIMPVDVSGSDIHSAIKLQSLYSKLNEYPSKKITVFMDACFSGGGRGQGLVAARGVKVKAKEDALSGNVVVFTSSSGDQSSLPFKDKQHGMFTYFLLKKLQETKGNTSYKSLSDYLSEKVGLNSVRINDKEQNPQTIISSDIQSAWGQWILNGNK